MIHLPNWYRTVSHHSTAPVRWAAAWGRISFFGSVMVVRAFSPASYGPQTRQNLARHMYLDTAPILGWFTVLISLFTLILTHIVIVTAASYGLSQYALEMVVRVLIIELIPLTAALFVALRCTIPSGAALVEMRRIGHFHLLRHKRLDPIAVEVLPRMLAGVFACITLAALSCVVAGALAYLAVYGFTFAGEAAYTHMVGRVFEPMFTLIFAMKTVFFALAVSMIPMASGLNNIEDDGSRESAALQGLVRMFGVLLVLEAMSLVANYL
ncbi:ABC transporter permease [Ramlibacter sp. G-1-2-2]|uniref:ABC transporter permease n=1 Tax=Ramlibacter agri TaxID=2728837 RepID=A0A848GWG8_9BURK|nr:ABC transporter permease [Ramlibacter agri]NML42996.1 ABC transporter permease [Ramlibacter agri]